MSKRIRGFVLAAIVVACCSQIYALYSDLVVTTYGINGNVVTVSVSNPTSTSAAARIRVTVRLGDDSTAILTRSVVTVAANGTTNVNLAAAGTVGTILEGPEPITPF